MYLPRLWAQRHGAAIRTGSHLPHSSQRARQVPREGPTGPLSSAAGPGTALSCCVASPSAPALSLLSPITALPKMHLAECPPRVPLHRPPDLPAASHLGYNIPTSVQDPPGKGILQREGAKGPRESPIESPSSAPWGTVTITGFCSGWGPGEGEGRPFPVSLCANSLQTAKPSASMMSLDLHNCPGVKWGQEGGDGPGVIQGHPGQSRLAPGLGFFLRFSALSCDPVHFTLLACALVLEIFPGQGGPSSLGPHKEARTSQTHLEAIGRVWLRGASAFFGQKNKTGVTNDEDSPGSWGPSSFSCSGLALVAASLSVQLGAPLPGHGRSRKKGGRDP